MVMEVEVLHQLCTSELKNMYMLMEVMVEKYLRRILHQDQERLQTELHSLKFLFPVHHLKLYKVL